MKTRQGILHTTVLERTSVVSKGENGTKWSRRQRTWVLQAKETAQEQMEDFFISLLTVNSRA